MINTVKQFSKGFRKHFRFYGVFLTLVAVMASCSKDRQPDITLPDGPYANGFFIVNEGWFGQESGSVNYYGYGADTLQTKVFAAENGGQSPTISTATLEDGLRIGDKLFLISQYGGPITVADAGTLKALGQIQMEGADFRAMTALDEHRALVSSGDGIYIIDLSSLKIGAEPVYTGQNIKKLLVVDNYLLASSNNGVDIISTTDWSLLEHFDGPTEGYVKTPDGAVYGAADNLLVRINPANQDTAQIALPQGVFANAYSYTPPCLVASSRQNALFYVATPTSGFSGNTIYKYVKGDAASLAAPFISLPANETFYGAGLAYDKKEDQIVTISVTGFSETDRNFLRFYDASNGELVKTIEYGHLYFPASIVF